VSDKKVSVIVTQECFLGGKRLKKSNDKVALSEADAKLLVQLGRAKIADGEKPKDK